MANSKSILILCTANSARSQMAEGLLKHICTDKYNINSAGSFATVVRPEAIKVLEEIGIDISEHKSKAVDEFAGEKIDIVLTVCDNAKETCPYFAGTTSLVHHSFSDPASVEGSEKQKIAAFREVRDQIKAYLINEFLPKFDLK